MIIMMIMIIITAVNLIERVIIMIMWIITITSPEVATAPDGGGYGAEERARGGGAAEAPTGKRESKEGTERRAREKKDVWMPWKARLKAHQDAVLFVEVIYDFRKHQAADSDGDLICLLTASADGSTRLFDLSRSNPVVVQKQVLARPPVPAPPDAKGKVGAKYYTPQITNTHIHWNMSLKFHWKMQLKIHDDL